jgi:hypothetical protein
MQDSKNHTKWDPAYHFFLAPVVLLNVIYQGVRLARNPSFDETWGFMISLALVVAVLKLRTGPLKAQDRLIRLEERLRLRELLPASQHALIPQLTEDQLIGLRFASDGEVAELAQRAVTGKLTRKQIKEAIQTWRPDDFRV